MFDVGNIFGSLEQAVAGGMNVLSAIFEGVADLIWVSSADGGNFTFLGTILLVVVGAPLAFTGLQYVISMINKIRVAKKGGK